MRCLGIKLITGKKNIPQKVLRYFSLISRLQKMYMSTKIFEEMRWHHKQRILEENILSHLAYTLVWKDLDAKHPYFTSDPHNIRLDLATDGFNLFDNLSTSYNMWSLMLVVYNVSPWKVHERTISFYVTVDFGSESTR